MVNKVCIKENQSEINSSYIVSAHAVSQIKLSTLARMLSLVSIRLSDQAFEPGICGLTGAITYRISLILLGF